MFLPWRYFRLFQRNRPQADLEDNVRNVCFERAEQTLAAQIKEMIGDLGRGGSAVVDLPPLPLRSELNAWHKATVSFIFSAFQTGLDRHRAFSFQ
ncbi:hypothetical protein Q3C01_18105 [Bradyrhizobium sp. UFLA05-109]